MRSTTEEFIEQYKKNCRINDKYISTAEMLIEFQREILKGIIKKTIARIKSLQIQLENEKQERAFLGGYADCGSFYTEQVVKTEAIISELISQKISLEKWRKKLKFEIVYGHAS